MPDPIRPEFPFGGLEPPFPHPYPVGGDFPSMVGGDDDLHPNLEGASFISYNDNRGVLS